VLAPGAALDDDLITPIRRNIRAEVSPRHVPDDIIVAPGVPVTITGKKLEVPVKRLLQGVPETTAVNRATVANPQVLDWYAGYAARYRRRQGRSEEKILRSLAGRAVVQASRLAHARNPHRCWICRARSRSERLVSRPWFSSTSWEVCQKNMYGLMVVLRKILRVISAGPRALTWLQRW
jgi:hypothetical protein